MEIASSFSTAANTVEALQDAYAVLVEKLGGAPTWMTVHGTYHHSGEMITTTLQTLAPGVPFQGGSSCLGVMTEAGFHSEQGMGLGLLGISDPKGVYGVGCAELTVDSRESGREAIKRALQNAGKNTPPRVVWITCAPGDEEEILDRMQEVAAQFHFDDVYHRI